MLVKFKAGKLEKVAKMFDNFMATGEKKKTN